MQQPALIGRQVVDLGKPFVAAGGVKASARLLLMFTVETETPRKLAGHMAQQTEVQR